MSIKYREEIISKISHKDNYPINFKQRLCYIEQLYDVIIRSKGDIKRNIQLSTDNKNNKAEALNVITKDDINVDPRILIYGGKVKYTSARKDKIEKCLLVELNKLKFTNGIYIYSCFYNFGVIKNNNGVYFILDYKNKSVLIEKKADEIVRLLLSRKPLYFCNVKKFDFKHDGITIKSILFPKKIENKVETEDGNKRRKMENNNLAPKGKGKGKLLLQEEMEIGLNIRADENEENQDENEENQDENEMSDNCMEFVENINPNLKESELSEVINISPKPKPKTKSKTRKRSKKRKRINDDEKDKEDEEDEEKRPRKRRRRK